MNHNLIRTAVYATLAFAMAGCAQLPVDSPQKQTSASRIKASPTIRWNNMTLTPAVAQDYKLGRFSGMPLIKNDDDLKALDVLQKQYVDIATYAAKKKDWDTFLVARQLARYLSEYRLYVTSSSVAAVRSMMQNGNISILPGSYVVLPAFNRMDKPAPAKLSLDESMFIGKGVLVADASNDLTNLVRTVNEALNGAQQGTHNADVVGSIRVLQAMPEGEPFKATDAFGNVFIIERSNDSFVLHNPGKNPVVKKPEDINFIPRIVTPDATRVAARPIIENLNKIESTMARSANNTGYAIAPNTYRQFGVGDVLLDELGNPTQDATAVERGRKAYKTNPSYRLAIDMFSRRVMEGTQYFDFNQSCKTAAGSNSYLSWSFQGTSGEIETLTCYKPSSPQNLPLYSKSWYLSNNLQLQTYSSLMNDQQTINEIKSAMGMSEMMDGIASLAPFYGSFDSAHACLFGKSFTAEHFNPVRNGDPRELSPFVNLPDDDSSMDMVLNCLDAIPVPGRIAHKVGSLIKNMPKTEQTLAKTHRISELFNAAWTNKGWDEVDQILKQDFNGEKSNAAVGLVKLFYNGIQQSNTFKAITEGGYNWVYYKS